MSVARALVVANPVAGRGRGSAVGRQVAAGLAARGVRADLHLTSGRGDATRRVRGLEPEVELVVAVGGDGTLREVLAGLPDATVPVGLVPTGTANVVSRELRLPADPARAVDIILGGRTVPLDAGRVNGALCCFVTGVGIDGLIVREVERRRRGPITRWSYVGALLRVLRDYRPPPLRVEIDGREVPGQSGFALITTSTRYAGLFRLVPGPRPADGRADVYLFGGGLASLAVAAVGGLVSRAGVAARRLAAGKSVRVTAPVPVPYEVDGDVGGETPCEIQVAALRFWLVAPGPVEW